MNNKKFFPVIFLSAMLLLSACSGQKTNETTLLSQGSDESEMSDTSQTISPTNTLSLKNNNSVVVETNGQKYYRYNGLIYHLIDDKNVELLSYKTEKNKLNSDYSDPVFKKYFGELYDQLYVGDNCLFGVDSEKENINCYTLDNNTIVKSSVLYTKDQFNEFISKESKNTEHPYSPLECMFEVRSSDDGYVYFVNKGISPRIGAIQKDNALYRICRLAIDGSGLEFIGTDTARSIDVKDNYLYYINTGFHYTGGAISYEYESEKSGIYRIRTDGTDKKLLCKLNPVESPNILLQPRNLRVVGDYLYFLDSDNNIKRVSIEGGEIESVTAFNGSHSLQSYCIDPEKSVVYCKETNNEHISKTSFGSQKSEYIFNSNYQYWSTRSLNTGFADIDGNYLYICSDYLSSSYLMSIMKTLKKDAFIDDSENENCLCREMPSFRCNLTDNSFEKVFEIIQFTSKADLEKFKETKNYDLIESTRFEWRKIDIK